MLRVTVREDFSYELASDLITDLKTVIEWLDHHFIYSGTTGTHVQAKPDSVPAQRHSWFSILCLFLNCAHTCYRATICC